MYSVIYGCFEGYANGLYFLLSPSGFCVATYQKLCDAVKEMDRRNGHA